MTNLVEVNFMVMFPESIKYKITSMIELKLNLTAEAEILKLYKAEKIEKN